jgi:2,5-diamino-6-(ribosylamino)-4(3H)-pyrimidinone 5'-phosphate reductase
MTRPITTLYLIQSLDGKISTGDTDELDVDRDFKRIAGVKEGLHQYYDIEKQTGPFSLNTGRVMAKIGVNTKTTEPKKIACSFIIIDNQPHLTEHGVRYLAKWVDRLFLVTTNSAHPAYKAKEQHDNIEIIHYQHTVNLPDVLHRLKTQYSVEKLTIQSGGTLNASWIREGLIDYVSIVIAPCLIGGSKTQSLIGGESIHTEEDLKNIRTLDLISCTQLNNSYIHLMYKCHTDAPIIDVK